LGEVLSLDATADGGQIDVLTALRGHPDDRLVHRRSPDGGRTWSAEREVDLGGRPMHEPHRGMDPQVAARGDRLLAVWTAPGTSEWGTGPMATSLSADGGRTWTPGPTPADDGRTDGHNYLDAAVDDQGAFHVVWLDNRAGGRGLSAARSADGRAWSASRTLDDRTCECCWNRLYAGPAGRLWVVYRDKLPTDLVVAASGDRGASWRRLGAPGDFGWRFEGCPHVGGALARPASAPPGELFALSWTAADGAAGLWAVASRDGGASWSAPRRIGEPTARHGDLAAVGDRLVAVWDQGARIYAAWSDDRGDTWSPPAALSAPGRRATHPRVVASGDGAVALWTEAGDEGGATWVARRLERG
jgi:hypothetical protein